MTIVRATKNTKNTKKCSLFILISRARYRRRMSTEPPTELIYPTEAFRLQGAVFEVYRTMGPGFLEGVYQECLGVELEQRDIPFQALKPIAISYKGRPLRQGYVADFVCFDRIIVELKAIRAIAPEHRA